MLIGLNRARTFLLGFLHSGLNTLLLIFIWVKISVHPNELNISVCYSLYATYRTRSNDPLSNICIAICNTNTNSEGDPSGPHCSVLLLYGFVALVLSWQYQPPLFRYSNLCQNFPAPLMTVSAVNIKIFIIIIVIDST